MNFWQLEYYQNSRGFLLVQKEIAIALSRLDHLEIITKL